MTFEQARRWVVLIVGVIVLVYALVPPLKPPYLTAAGALLGFGPVAAAATPRA